MAQEQALRLDEKVRAEDVLYASMLHHGDGKMFAVSGLISFVISAAILLFNFPEFKKAVVPQKKKTSSSSRSTYPLPPRSRSGRSSRRS